MSRVRLLFLACHLPFPPLSGGRRRELELIKRLSERFEVQLMVVSKTFDEDRANAGELERWCRRVEVFPAAPLPRDPARAPEPIKLLRHRCDELTRRVREVVAGGQVDLVHVEGFYLMQHVPPELDVPLVLVEQNVEYELERQGAREASLAAVRTMRAEVAAWRRADLVGVLTPEDREAVHAVVPPADVRLVPDGADHLPVRTAGDRPAERPRGPLVVFVGNFAYGPNVDAAAYLCEEILPRIEERVPDVHVWLVGNEPPDAVRARAGARVRVTGRVPDVVPYVDAADVVVCPLRIGGGVKVKAIEALRRGKAIVSSTIGAQGLPPAARDAIAIADDPAAFANATARLLADADRRDRAERLAADAARELPTWDEAAAALAAAYDEVLEERRALEA